MSEREPTQEELRAALEEQLRRITVADVLFQTVATLVNLCGRRLGLAGDPHEGKDLEQARTAIEAVRALLPLLPGEESKPVRDALAQLQMAYAREAEAPAAKAGAGGDPPADQQAGGPPAEEAERAKARSKLWTPPGV